MSEMGRDSSLHPSHAPQAHGGGVAEATGPRLGSRDLYLLRRTALELERRRQALRRAELTFQCLLLHLEAKYGLLGKATTVDLTSGWLCPAKTTDHAGVASANTEGRDHDPPHHP